MTARPIVEKRPATRADILEAYGQIPPVTVRAWVWERDGEILTIAGWYRIPGAFLVFSDMFLDNPPAVGVFRRAKEFMESVPFPAVCVGSDASRPFLERLGWRYVGPTAEGGVFTWQDF